MALSTVTSEVRMTGKIPSLFVNGKRHAATFVFLRKFEKDEIRRFTDQGVRLFTFWSDLFSDRSSDFKELRKRMDIILDAAPDALIMPRVFLDGWSDKMVAWLKEHPSEAMTTDMGIPCYGRPSYASEIFFQGISKECLINYLETCNRNYAGSVMGHHLGIGACGELIWTWGSNGDYATCVTNEFRKWCRIQYGGALKELNKVWHTDFPSFDVVELPPATCRYGSEHGFRFPAKHQYAIDYEVFMQDLAVKRVADAVAICKKVCNRKKLCGVFFGYVLGLNGYVNPVHDQISAHGRLIKLLDNPDVDFIASPYGYYDRKAGGSDYGQHPENSTIMHGKLSFAEIDTRTCLESDYASIDTTARDFINLTIPSSREVMKRNFSYAYINELPFWWMEHSAHNWFNHPDFLSVIKQSVESTDSDRPEQWKPAAEAALFVDERAQMYLSPDTSLLLNNVFFQHNELKHAGFPFETYLLDDLENIKRTFKLYIFMKTVRLTNHKIKLINDRIRRDHASVLWLGPCGIVGDDSFSLENVYKATGFNVKFEDGVTLPKAVLDPKSYDTPIGKTPDNLKPLLYGGRYRAPSNMGTGTYETCLPQEGLLYFDDPDATVLAHSYIRHRPVLAVKDKALFATFGALPAHIIANFAETAGIWLYTAPSPVVYACDGKVAVHFTAVDSPCVVRMPESFKKVRDIFTGAEFICENGRITLTTTDVATYCFIPCKNDKTNI